MLNNVHFNKMKSIQLNETAYYTNCKRQITNNIVKIHSRDASTPT